MSFGLDFTTAPQPALPLPLLPKGRKRLILELSEEDEEIQDVAEKSLGGLKRPRESDAAVGPLNKKQRREVKKERSDDARSLMKEANLLAWQAKGAHKGLDKAIPKYHRAFEIASHDEWLKSVILLNWGDALLKRNRPAKPIRKPIEKFTSEERLYGEISDADLAIAKYVQGLVCIKHDEDVDGRLRLGKGKAYLAKYQTTGQQIDLIFALQSLHEGVHFPVKNNEIKAGLLKAKGQAHCFNKDYATGVQCYREALALSFDNETLRENIETVLSKALATINENQADVLKAKGEAHCRDSDYVAGAECYREALALSFDNQTLRDSIDNALRTALAAIPVEASPASA